MKKLATLAVIATAILSACNGGKLREAEAQNEQLKGDLCETLATQDSLLVLVNDISDGMNQIKDLEKIISTPGSLGESVSRRDQIKNDMIAIQKALQERRERLAELEKKLKSSQGYNATLQKTIDNLKAEIATQETTISTLRNDLAAAKIQIADLGTKVDSLSTTVASVTEEKVKAQEETQNVTNELNTCYYAIGTKKELKEAKIIETGFLRKTKLLQADFQQSYFTKADKRTMTVIPTQSKKAKILTNMPSDSYVIEDEGDTKVIKVTNPERFWSLSNYLVIQVD